MGKVSVMVLKRKGTRGRVHTEGTSVEPLMRPMAPPRGRLTVGRLRQAERRACARGMASWHFLLQLEGPRQLLA